MVPQIWSTTDRIFCHSGPLFAILPSMDPEIKTLKKWKKPEDIILLQMCTINNSHMMYGSGDMECNRQNLLSFRTIFCPFNPITTRKLNFWKNEKKVGDIVILHMCNLNDNHMMYGSSDMEHNRQNFLSFWTAFSYFTLHGPRKSKLWKNEKNLKILSFYKCVP